MTTLSDVNKAIRRSQYGIIQNDNAAEILRRLKFTANSEEQRQVIQDMLYVEQDLREINIKNNTGDLGESNVYKDYNSTQAAMELYETGDVSFIDINPIAVPTDYYCDEFAEDYPDLFDNYNIERFFEDPNIQQHWTELFSEIDTSTFDGNWPSRIKFDIHSNILLPLQELLEKAIVYNKQNQSEHSFIDANEDGFITFCEALESRQFKPERHTFYDTHFRGAIKELKQTYLEFKAEVQSPNQSRTNKHTHSNDLSI